jgi:dimethylargininase
MDRPIAIVKRPASTLADRCELTFLQRSAISFDALERQHRAYREALQNAGADVVVLDADPALPDSVFVEDTAVVLDEIAVMAHPGAASRQAEPDRIEAEIARHRSIVRIAAPGTLEGGDVLRIGRTLYVGLSTRSNREGVEQLATQVRPHGYHVVPVQVSGSLHLKTACTALDACTVLLNPAWLDVAAFADFRTLAVHADEPFAANVLPVGKTLIANAAFPRTLECIESHARSAGRAVVAVDIPEFAKAEAGLTCMSLIFSGGCA